MIAISARTETSGAPTKKNSASKKKKKKKLKKKKKKKKEEEVKEKQTRKQSHLPQGGGFIISIMHSFILLPGRHRDDSSSLFGIPRFRFGVEVKLIQRPNCGSASYCVTDCCSQQ